MPIHPPVDFSLTIQSLGNFITLEDSIKKFDPYTIRYFIASSHYRSVIDYTENSIRTADRSSKNLNKTVRDLRKALPENAKPSEMWFKKIKDKFINAMDDDFSTPQAIAALFELNNETKELLSLSSPNLEAIIDSENLFSLLGGKVLGIIKNKDISENTYNLEEDIMQIILDLRNNFRLKNDFKNSDLIRERLDAIGIVLNDLKNGTFWKKKY